MQGLFQDGDFKKVNGYISNFSLMLRSTIDHSDRILVKLENEIEYLNSYLRLEQEKKLNAFRYDIIYDNSNILNYFVPSLVIQPVVENCVKHGIKKGGDFIEVVFSVDTKNGLICTIHDNGAGISPIITDHHRNSIGVNLIKDKIKIVEDVLQITIDYSFDNKYFEGSVIGTVTRFVFPLIDSNSSKLSLNSNQFKIY
jgi:LytS/YehU family sensor histidine kinase